jgi:hypothetical protein
MYYGDYDPALPPGHPFINFEEDDYYWSSTTSLDLNRQALFVDGGDGVMGATDKDTNHSMWPVRGGQ